MIWPQRTGVGLLAALSVPFIVTVLFRVLPPATPTSVPFAALGIVAMALLLGSRLRWLGVGLFLGAGAWAAFLLWLFMTWSDGLSGFD